MYSIPLRWKMKKITQRITAVTLLLGLGVALWGCSKEEHSAEEVNAVVAERLDLNEEHRQVEYSR